MSFSSKALDISFSTSIHWNSTQQYQTAAKITAQSEWVRHSNAGDGAVRDSGTSTVFLYHSKRCPRHGPNELNTVTVVVTVHRLWYRHRLSLPLKMMSTAQFQWVMHSNCGGDNAVTDTGTVFPYHSKWCPRHSSNELNTVTVVVTMQWLWYRHRLSLSPWGDPEWLTGC